ncbi:MAG: rod shape-determining protein MreD [Anaerolineales bacterium]|jgi:rod shape-determining protein MreD
MIWIIAVPLLILAALLQSAVLTQIQIFGGSLGLPLLMVLCWSILRPEEGLGWAALGGLFSDLLSGGPLGSTSIAFTIAALAAGQLQGRLWGRHPLIIMALALLGTGISHLVSLALLGFTGRPVDVGFALAYVTLPTAFFNTLFVLPVYGLLSRLHYATRGKPAVSELEE